MSPSSIYVQCADAARRLLDNPDLRIVTTDAPEGIFTELDVIFLASREGDYNPEMMKVAQREASQVMGTLFRSGQAVKFGPVQVPGLDQPDYMRVASKLVFAHPEGPKAIKTPNGTFSRLGVDEDLIVRQGRRPGANRNDLESWEDQDILHRRSGEPTTAQEREIARLQAELAAATHRYEEAEAELHRLREHRATVTHGNGTKKPAGRRTA